MRDESGYTVMTTSDHATVLVVDDQANVRRLQRRVLEGAGYRVTEACSGYEAVALFGDGQRFDLLIADIAMPGMSGVEMAFTIRRMHPDQKVLYVTGQLGRLINARPLWQGEAFLEKPFSLRSLREAVALLLDGTLKPSATGKVRPRDRSPEESPGSTGVSLGTAGPDGFR
jgi:CheY-like chemotaxis protein